MKTVCFIRQTAIYNDSRATKTIISLSKKYNVLVLGWDRVGDAREKIQGLFSGNVFLNFYDKHLQHGAGIKGIFKLLGFIKWVHKQVKNNCKNIDFIHACDLDAAVGCYKFAKKRKIPFIYDVYDYYIDAHYIPTILKNNVEKKEIDIINSSFSTIVCLESRKEQIKKANPARVCVIHNAPSSELTEISNECKGSHDIKHIMVVFVGVLSENRLLKEIVEELDIHPNVKLIIGGMGQLSQYIIDACKPNLEYIGEMQYKNVLKLESQSSVLFATYNPEIPNHKYSAPNKLYEAMALGKPIIVCKGMGIDVLVEQENIGRAIDYSAKGFFDAVNSLCNDKAEYDEMCRHTKELFKTKYSWDIMEERLFDLYDSAEKCIK